MKKKDILITILVAVITLGVGFFAGMQYQKMQRANFSFGQGGGQFAQRAGGNARFGAGANRPVVGQIVSVDDNGVTVKMNDGSTKIVVVPSSATINKASTGSKSDLKTGVTIAVFGTNNSDGSVTAQNVQLNPQMRGPQTSPTGTK